MLEVLQSGSQQWLTFYQYDDSTGDLLLMAMPSAVTGFSEQYADLLNNVGGYQYLNENSGLIRTYAAHGPTGYMSGASVQQGQLGTAVQLSATSTSPCPRPRLPVRRALQFVVQFVQRW